MKHTLTVTIDTPEKAMQELRLLYRIYQHHADAGSPQRLAEAADFDQLKSALEAEQRATVLWAEVDACSRALASVLDGDPQKFIDAARRAA